MLSMIRSGMAATLDRKFEKFIAGPTQPPEQRIHVTMDKRNVIQMNKRCYREIGKPPAVYLHFSRVDDTIAVEPVHSYNLPSAFPVRSRRKDFSTPPIRRASSPARWPVTSP